MKPLVAIIFKDIVIEMRSKESISSMLMFGILVLIIFMFAFESSGVDKAILRARRALGRVFFRRHSRAESVACHGNRQRLSSRSSARAHSAAASSIWARSQAISLS